MWVVNAATCSQVLRFLRNPACSGLSSFSTSGKTRWRTSHCPCVTDNSGITTYRLMALGREMSTPPTLQWSMAHFTLPLLTFWSWSERRSTARPLLLAAVQRMFCPVCSWRTAAVKHGSNKQTLRHQPRVHQTPVHANVIHQSRLPHKVGWLVGV